MVKELIEIKREKPRYLILGASGLLGSRIYQDFSQRFETFGTVYNSQNPQSPNIRKLDLTDSDEVLQLLNEIRPTHIVNCVGLTDVELCESLPEASWKLNSDIPFRLAKLTSGLDIRFIHISTDHYFSIENSPRREMDEVIAVNQYGFTKILAEKLVLQENPESLILRTNFFGTSDLKKDSLLDFAVNNIRKGNQIYGFDDVVFSPVGIEQICRFLKSSQVSNVSGILNFASGKPLSKYEFMVLVAKAMGEPKANIIRSSIHSSNLTANRPNYLALNSSRLLQDVNFALPEIEEMIDLEITRNAQSTLSANTNS